MNNDKRVNIIVLVLGVIIYPLGLWGINIPNNVLYQMGLQEITFLSILFAWIISFVLVTISLIRFNTNKKRMIYWIGFILNLIYLITPIIIIIWILVRLFFYGIGV